MSRSAFDYSRKPDQARVFGTLSTAAEAYAREVQGLCNIVGNGKIPFAVFRYDVARDRYVEHKQVSAADSRVALDRVPAGQYVVLNQRTGRSARFDVQQHIERF